VAFLRCPFFGVFGAILGHFFRDPFAQPHTLSRSMQIGIELDTSRPRKDGTCRVRVMLYHQKLARHALDLTVHPDQWDHKRQRLKFGTPNWNLKNAVIDAALQRAEALAIANPGITADHLRDLLSTEQGPASERLHESLSQHVKDHAHRLAYATRKGRVTVVRDVEQALPLATLAGLSVSQIMDLDRWYVERGLGTNTRRSRLRRLRTMYRASCKTKGIPAKDLFDGLIPAEVDTGAKFLAVDELEKLAKATLPTHTMTLARDAWMLCFYLGGIRVGDVCRLNWTMVDGDAITWTAGKVPKPRWVPLSAGALAIMERHRGAFYILPLIPEGLQGDALEQAIESATSTLNRSLKDVCRVLSIRPLTMHMARHTWAETAQGATLDVRSVSRILGHARTATTERYLSRFDRVMIKDVFDRIEGHAPPKPKER